MLSFFRERHVTERRRIDVTADKDISALLASSMGKLGGIQAIVRKEAENLGKGLRMVILTNYIKKNLTTLIGTEDPLVEMGTVPIFEALRRDKIPGARLGVLSGMLAILPDAAVAALSRLALAEECSVSAKTIGDAGFSRIEFSRGNKKKGSHRNKALPARRGQRPDRDQVPSGRMLGQPLHNTRKGLRVGLETARMLHGPFTEGGCHPKRNRAPGH